MTKAGPRCKSRPEAHQTGRHIKQEGTSNRKAHGVVDQEAVEDAAALGELEVATLPSKDGAIDADLVELGIGAIERYLHEHVVCSRLDASMRVLAQHRQVPDEMTQISGREHRGLLEREGAVPNHLLVFAVNQPGRQSAIEIF